MHVCTGPLAIRAQQLGYGWSFDSLAVRCDGQHTHQAWSASRADDNGEIFDTVAEAEYSALLRQCKEVLQASHQAACIWN